MKNKYFLAATLLIILFMAIKCGSTKTIPDELIGAWKTQAINYSDTFFELRKDQISFGAKTGEVFNYAVTKVKRGKKRHSSWILYTVYYKNDILQTYELSLYFQPSGNGVIFLKNTPDVVWVKDKHF